MNVQISNKETSCEFLSELYNQDSLQARLGSHLEIVKDVGESLVVPG